MSTKALDKAYLAALATAHRSNEAKHHDQRWTSLHDQAYMALQKAGERIGAAEFGAGHYKVKRRQGKVIQGYSISPEHKQVIDALNDLGRFKITPEEAMNVLHEYDVIKARTR
jgi:6-phosphogluconolactonase (cycloisomerase 2 family)